jgi:hypothetical protein
MAAQLELALDNLEAVPGEAGMTLATTLLGVTRLPAPQLLVMLEATAVD